VFLASAEKQLLRTMPRNHALESSPCNPSIYRMARSHAIWTTSRASCSSFRIQRARLNPASRCGSKTFSSRAELSVTEASGRFRRYQAGRLLYSRIPTIARKKLQNAPFVRCAAPSRRHTVVEATAACTKRLSRRRLPAARKMATRT
jgi:hypothetical protein